ncbi:DUF2637 domain-containing protein [Kitasatospora sp. NPDC101155]|uniref:DUF2637 domain-containing protein n=1 Tax=Kitasatospora sp. NPDC101155 TaxID=3364097 RepID=UPI00381CFBF3
MTATTPAAPGPTDPGAFTRITVTMVMAVIAALAFVFSFGNVWALALRLGIPHPIAPLIAPMVDLSVVGLLVALHHLALTGTKPDQLRPATRLMHLCGMLTLALNTAEPVIAGHYGRAALDTVAPALLLGWGAVGPNLLRHLATPTPHPSKDVAPDPHRAPSPDTPTLLDQPGPVPATLLADTASAAEPRTPEDGTEPGQGPTPPLPPTADLTTPDAEPAPVAEPDPEPKPAAAPAPAPAPPVLPDVPAPLLGAARRIADDHRARTGAVITPGELRARLGVPPRLADAVHAHLAAVPA